MKMLRILQKSLECDFRQNFVQKKGAKFAKCLKTLYGNLETKRRNSELKNLGGKDEELTFY